MCGSDVCQDDKNQYRYQVPHPACVTGRTGAAAEGESSVRPRCYKVALTVYADVYRRFRRPVVMSHFKLFLHFFCPTPLHLWDGSTCCSVNPTDPRPSALWRLRMIWKRHKTFFFFSSFARFVGHESTTHTPLYLCRVFSDPHACDVNLLSERSGLISL